MTDRSGFAHLGGLTPIEVRGGLFIKRDDLYLAAGAPGGKARSCWHLAQGAPGLVTASSRQSPQIGIVARVAAELDIPCRAHMPTGPDTPEMVEARALGAEIVAHRPGYNSVIVARARADALQRGWREIPFGMECQEAVNQTKGQVANLPFGSIARIVVPVGSGMSLAGILWGLSELGCSVPVMGIMVGADPTKRLDRWAPPLWPSLARLSNAGVDYHAHAAETSFHGLALDPVYEAKCLPHLQPGDLFWLVGIRGTELYGQGAA